jgi:hypothetical protein
VPAEYAAALEAMNPKQAAELLEDLADGADAREALSELAAGAQPVPALAGLVRARHRSVIRPQYELQFAPKAIRSLRRRGAMTRARLER